VGCSACNAISASKRLPNNTCWRLARVTDLVGGSSLDAVKTSPKNACWCRERAGFKTAFPCTTHTHHFPFVHLLNIQSNSLPTGVYFTFFLTKISEIYKGSPYTTSPIRAVRTPRSKGMSQCQSTSPAKCEFASKKCSKMF
jgi:hypothetical protein